MPWLMKAEPDSRVVKGKDVKFSVDDFEQLGVSPWDGVRSHEAKNIMKSKMKQGDRVLFYHSNCKVPGVYAVAEVAKEGYPDHTAWDPAHPYFDAKTDSAAPTWYMVDVRFVRRLPHPVTLSFVRALAGGATLPPEVAYIGEEGWKAVRGMALINRGRLSVQPVEDAAFDAVVELGTKGGWTEEGKGKGKKGKGAAEEEVEGEEVAKPVKANKGTKRKAAPAKKEPVAETAAPVQRRTSKRTKR